MRAPGGFWKKPVSQHALAVLGLATATWALVSQAAGLGAVGDTVAGGLHLEVRKIGWLLGDMAALPPALAMRLGPPRFGIERLTVEVGLHNPTAAQRAYRAEEFVLVASPSLEMPLAGAQPDFGRLAVGDELEAVLCFDLDSTLPHDTLRLEWRRGGDTFAMGVPAPPAREHLKPRPGTDLPADVQLLEPAGEAGRGARLYSRLYGCGACHGDPAVAASNNVGPHLGRIAEDAEQRVAGVASRQYIWESIVDPDRFIAPGCKGGPCADPTAMPDFTDLMTIQDAADLMAFLMTLQN